MAAIQGHGRHTLKLKSPETVSYSFGFHSHVGAIIGVLEFGSVLKTIIVAGQFVDRTVMSPIDSLAPARVVCILGIVSIDWLDIQWGRMPQHINHLEGSGHKAGGRMGLVNVKRSREDVGEREEAAVVLLAAPA